MKRKLPVFLEFFFCITDRIQIFQQNLFIISDRIIQCISADLAHCFLNFL